MTLMPLLIIALLVWAGVFVFTWALDRCVALLERRALDLMEARTRAEETSR